MFDKRFSVPYELEKRSGIGGISEKNRQKLTIFVEIVDRCRLKRYSWAQSEPPNNAWFSQKVA